MNRIIEWIMSPLIALAATVLVLALLREDRE